MCGSSRARSTPGDQPMSKLFSKTILMLCMLALSGCSVCQMLYVNFFFEESVTSKKLKEMDPGEYKYLKDIYNEQWQKVCVRLPYSTPIGGPSINFKEPCFNKKTGRFRLMIGEGLWHLKFFRNAHDDKHFDYISFKTRDIDIIHEPAGQEIIDSFKQAGFSPAHCAERDQAVMFRFGKKWQGRDYMYITLGVINQ